MTAAIYWSGTCSHAPFGRLVVFDVTLHLAANYVADSKNLDGSNFFTGFAIKSVPVQVFDPAAQLNVSYNLSTQS